MNDIASLERCQAFINCNLQSPHQFASTPQNSRLPRAVTISRQAGCGALLVAEKLAALLQKESPGNAPPWTVFDHNLMETVMQDHNLPARIAQFIPEDRMTELQDISEELFGLRPGSWAVVQQTSETILRLVEMGRVIIIGRGSNLVTARLPGVLHVRLVAPLEQRVQHVHEFHEMTKPKAREFCRREDRGRERYVKKYFNADVSDPLLYHLTINTGIVGYDQAAELIMSLARAAR